MFSLSFAQQVEHVGCIRFGMPADDPRLLNWKAACTAAGTPRDVRRALEKVGEKMGGSSAHWFATIATVPINELSFQVWINGWFDATSPQDMAIVRTQTPAVD